MKTQYHTTTIRIPLELWVCFQRLKPAGMSLNRACVDGIYQSIANKPTATPPDQIEAALAASLDHLKRIQLEGPSR